MRLTNLHVVNYRGLRDVSIPLSLFVCITGENNGGKSSVLQSLSLFLSGSSIKATDFFTPQKPITIAVTLSNITTDDLKLLADEHRSRISALLVDQTLTLVRQYGTDGKSELGYYGLAPREPRFTDANILKLIAGRSGGELKKSVLAKFPELKEQIKSSVTQKTAKELIKQLGEDLPLEDKETRFLPLPTGVDKSVIPMLPERIYIPAVKDLSDDTKTAETSSFGKILAIVMKAIEPLLSNEKDLFENLSKKLTRLVDADGNVQDNRLDEIKNIERLIEAFVRESFTNVKLEIEIPPPDLKSLLATARIFADDGVRGPVETKGDGLRRAVVFSILRAYMKFARASATGDNELDLPERGYLLLFEEPELFLHPDGQMMLFDALEVFSKRNHVVVTTHSPLFLGANATATFVRLSKTAQANVPKPFTTSCHVDLSGLDPRDEFQIICFENNSAAFFAKRIVLVEGDSDFIVFPFIAEMLNEKWTYRSRSIAFVRVGGKGSIARYRSFFERFHVPVYVIADLDSLDDNFEKLQPTEEARRLRTELIQRADAANMGHEDLPSVNAEDIRRAQANAGIRSLWEDVRSAKMAWEKDNSKFRELNSAIESFFAWEKKSARRECIRKAEDSSVRDAKLALIWELRKNGVFVLERGSLEDYYPHDLPGSDKPSKAQAFRHTFCTRELLLPLSPIQTCPIRGTNSTEFEFICSGIFE